MTEQQPSHGSFESLDQVPESWRNEVQARLERYKGRRGRRIEGAFTMRFPFPPVEPSPLSPEVAEAASAVVVEEPPPPEPEPTSPIKEPSVVDEGVPQHCSVAPEIDEAAERAQQQGDVESRANDFSPELELEKHSSPLIEMPPRPQPRRKVIAFPCPTRVQEEVARRLADPVQPEQLRILDVPEELQAIPGTPFLEGLLDAPAGLPAQVDATELPCPAVSGSKRLGAALIDAVAVLAGMVAFLAAASRLVSQDLPQTKFVIAGGLAISVLLWASYQYLFVVYGGRTFGMKLTRTCLQSFKGRSLTLRQRRSRVMALYLSVLSLGMGVLWSFVDIDRLCWHDRISQTFPASGKSLAPVR